jgi:hypothetical protein
MTFVCGKLKECAMRKLDGAVKPLLVTCRFTDPMLHRLREAIECLKRALIGAAPHETTINLKLAKLHNDLGEWAEAAAYHRRVVEICRASGWVFILLCCYLS